jgi:hypothetical protein
MLTAAALGVDACPAKISRPFVFRKYLDFGAINAMRDLHAQIRREVARKDKVDHVKLGPRRHSRNRVHRPGLPANPRRPRPGTADPTDLSVLKLLAERKLIPPRPRASCAKPMFSCVVSNTACNTLKTSRPTCCRRDDDARASPPAAWTLPTGRPCCRPRRTSRKGQPSF